MSRHDEFEALAEKLLLIGHGKNTGYTPPENAHMVVDTALAMAEDFLAKLKARREEKDAFDGLTQEEFDMVHSGNKIAAIKSIRGRTGMNLAEAKVYADQAAL